MVYLTQSLYPDYDDAIMTAGSLDFIQEIESAMHDIITPLSVVFTISQILSKEDLNKTEIRELASKIYKNTQLAFNIINDLSFADVNSYNPGYVPKNLSEFLMELVDSTRSLAERKNIKLEFVSMRKDIDCVFNKLSIERIMLNLISNAVKYTPISGKISIYLVSDEQHYKIRVKDSGLGISNELKPDIFKRYVKDISSQGRGIGLHTVHKIVTKLGGTVTAENCVDGGGLSVEVTLPHRKQESHL